MQDEYSGPQTGKPEQCQSILSNQSLHQQVAKKPFVNSLDFSSTQDAGIEKLVQKGVVVSKININKKVLQFY
jgi:hypothetical protein